MREQSPRLVRFGGQTRSTCDLDTLKIYNTNYNNLAQREMDKNLQWENVQLFEDLDLR